MLWYIITNELVNTDYAVGIVQVGEESECFISGSFSVQVFNSVVGMYSMRETKSVASSCNHLVLLKMMCIARVKM